MWRMYRQNRLFPRFDQQRLKEAKNVPNKTKLVEEVRRTDRPDEKIDSY